MTKSTPLGSSKKELKSRTIESYFTPLKKAKLSPSTLETTAKEGANSDTLAFSVQFEQNAKENAEFLANVRGIKSPTTGSMEESVEESNTLFATSMLSSPPAFKSPALSNQKRKQVIDIDPSSEAFTASDNVNPDKSSRKKIRTDAAKPAFSIKNGRVFFNEKKLHIDMMGETINDLALFFRSFDKDSEIDDTCFPAEFLPLIAKLIQDSDASLVQATKKIHSRLSVGSQGKMPYSLEQIENVITAVATRKNYGVGDGPHASVWRWEVNDLSIFSDELQKSIQERRVLRENAAKGLASAFDILSSEEKELIQSSSTKIDRDVLSKLKQQKELEKQLLKEAKEREKQVAKELKEQERLESAHQRQKEKEERELQKQKEKEEKELQKLKEKEERLSEKKRQLEEQQQKQASGQKKIFEFFKSKPQKPDEVVIDVTISDFESCFPQFHKKPNMIIAAHVNRAVVDLEARGLDFVARMRNSRVAFRRGSLKGTVAADASSYMKQTAVKILQFCENHRPAYYGTWNKMTTIISGRRPFAVDNEAFAYDVDSDDDWEEEDEEGDECLTDEEEELEDEEEDVDEDDWLVPHGYLSEDEGVDNEDDDMSRSNSPLKMKSSSKDADSRPKIKTEAIIPVVFGTCFEKNKVPQLLQYRISFFQDFGAVYDPLEQLNSVTEPNNTSENMRTKRILFPETMVPELIQILITMPSKGLDKIVDTFREKYGTEIPKTSIASKIKDIAVKEKRQGDSRALWYISTPNCEETNNEADLMKPDVVESLEKTTS